jgi:hypothetical protein
VRLMAVTTWLSVVFEVLSVVKYLCSVLALICERLRRSCWSVSAGVGVV